MKRYNLSAEFIRWEGDTDHSSEVDSFGYVMDLESEEEAQVRLNTLIIERMASKPGWSYKLLNSGYSEFQENESKIESQSIYEQALAEALPGDEQPAIDESSSADPELQLESNESDQLQV